MCPYSFTSLPTHTLTHSLSLSLSLPPPCVPHADTILQATLKSFWKELNSTSQLLSKLTSLSRHSHIVHGLACSCSISLHEVHISLMVLFIPETESNTAFITIQSYHVIPGLLKPNTFSSARINLLCL